MMTLWLLYLGTASQQASRHNAGLHFPALICHGEARHRWYRETQLAVEPLRVVAEAYRSAHEVNKGTQPIGEISPGLRPRSVASESQRLAIVNRSWSPVIWQGDRAVRLDVASP